MDNVLLKEYEPLYFAFYMLGMLTIERLRNRTMCKNGAFERIKEEVENEPQKLKWSILSILYMIFVVFFFLILLLYREIRVMTCYFAKGNKINGKPYEETGIYRARTKATLLFL